MERRQTAALKLCAVAFYVIFNAQAASTAGEHHMHIAQSRASSPTSFISAERASTCDMETGLCGWRLGEPEEGSYTIVRAQADLAPGPPADAVPGTAQG